MRNHSLEDMEMFGDVLLDICAAGCKYNILCESIAVAK